MASHWISSLVLVNFRSYPFLKVDFDQRPVAIYGANGTGKTNLLEAISLLTPGRGLRGAQIKDFQNFDQLGYMWAVQAALSEKNMPPLKITTGPESNGSSKRSVYINESQEPHTALLERLFITWITPKMGHLFTDPMSSQRKFIDKLACGFAPHHSKSLYRLEYALRERSILLKQGRIDYHWLKSLEQKIAEESIAISTTRQSFIQKLNQFSEDMTTQFPKPQVKIKGAIEPLLEKNSALDAEEKLQELLESSRQEDQLKGTNTFGAHQSLISVINLDCHRPAEVCSTGEQKALLLSIILSYCRLMAYTRGAPPILLLDEVAAHFDKEKREALFEEVCNLQVQTFMTGTSRELFEFLGDRAQYIRVEPGSIQKDI